MGKHREKSIGMNVYVIWVWEGILKEEYQMQKLCREKIGYLST